MVAHIICEGEGIKDGDKTTVRPNDDDDNENDVCDYLDAGEIDDEDDLRWIKACVGVGNLLKTDGSYYVVSAFLNFTNAIFRAWENVTRTILFLPSLVNPSPRYQLSPTNPIYTEDDAIIYVEGGLDEGVNDLILTVEIDEFSESEGNTTSSPTDLGTEVTTTVQNVDLFADIDIDSDNSVMGNSYPTRSDLEELIENDRHAPGKIIEPSWKDYDSDGILDCWEGGYGQTIPQGTCLNFYPIVLQIPGDVDLGELSISIDYNMFTSYSGSSNIPTAIAKGGQIRVWKKQGSEARLARSIKAEGGDLVSPVTDFTYTPQMLGFSESVRTITLYVEGITENIQKTEELAVEYGVPKTSIKFSVKRTVQVDDNNTQTFTYHDEVKYVVAKSKSFYYELALHPELTAAYVSESVYEREDGGGLGYRALSKGEIRGLKLLNVTISPPTGGGNDYQESVANILSLSSIQVLESDFNGLLYREFLTGKYVLAFAGTNMSSRADWGTNISQAMELSYPPCQYQYAMGIGFSLAQSETISNNDLIITGHSLGGGLASAAYVAAATGNKRFKTYTFNASGLNPNTPRWYLGTLRYHYQDQVEDIREIYSDERIESEISFSSQYIDAYHVDNDALTNMQTAFSPILPTAIGRSITIRSRYALLNWALIITVATHPSPISFISFAGVELLVGFQCHRIGEVIYGIKNTIW